MNLENKRKAFEEWASSNKWNIFKVSFANDDVEKYSDDFVEGAWHGWIQSANREGYKLVPVEPTKEMLDAQDYIRDESATEIYKAMIEAA